MLGNSSTLLFDLPYPGLECFYRQPPLNVVTELGSSSEAKTSPTHSTTENAPEESLSSSGGHDNETTEHNFDVKDVAVPYYDHSLRQDDVDCNELPPIWSFEEFERSSSTYCWLRKDIS